jgi:hypothetical protein
MTADPKNVHRFSGWGIAMMKERPATEYVLASEYDAVVAANERLRSALERIERLAAGNVTGCGTCHTILKEEFPRPAADVSGEQKPTMIRCGGCGSHYVASRQKCPVCSTPMPT